MTAIITTHIGLKVVGVDVAGFVGQDRPNFIFRDAAEMSGRPDASAFDVITKSWQPIPLADFMIAGLRLRKRRCHPFPAHWPSCVVILDNMPMPNPQCFR